jgi:hypothetical protein
MSTDLRDRRCSVFLKKRDKYALPINLTYNGLKMYPTAVGGCLSIFSNLLILTFLALSVLSILDYKHEI